MAKTKAIVLDTLLKQYYDVSAAEKLLKTQKAELAAQIAQLLPLPEGKSSATSYQGEYKVELKVTTEYKVDQMKVAELPEKIRDTLFTTEYKISSKNGADYLDKLNAKVEGVVEKKVSRPYVSVSI